MSEEAHTHAEAGKKEEGTKIIIFCIWLAFFALS